MTLPAETSLAALASGSAVAFSPDGTSLVYVANRVGKRLLYLREMDSFEAKPIPGTERAEAPFFSPDGQWVGFFAGGKLKKVSLAAGIPVTLCDAINGRGASWGPDDTIIFATWPGEGLMRVPAGGGTPQPISTLDSEKGEFSHRHPQFLPGGQAVLFTILSGQMASFGDASFAVLSLETEKKRFCLKGEPMPATCPVVTCSMGGKEAYSRRRSTFDGWM